MIYGRELFYVDKGHLLEVLAMLIMLGLIILLSNKNINKIEVDYLKRKL